MFDVPCCLCCREEEADWLDFAAYMRRKNVTNPWSLYFLYEIKKQYSLQIVGSHAL